jgi:hypothetical protein
LLASWACKFTTSWGITLGACSLICGSWVFTAKSASWRYLPNSNSLMKF